MPLKFKHHQTSLTMLTFISGISHNQGRAQRFTRIFKKKDYNFTSKILQPL